MSSDARIEFEWAGKERVFRLAQGEIRELEESRTVYAKGENGNILMLDSGMAAVAYSGALKCILDRLRTGTYLVDDISETQRLGLIGGGMARAEASALVKRECVPPYQPQALQAAAIIIAAIVGVRDDQLPKSKVAKKTRKRSMAPGVSASATSTA